MHCILIITVLGGHAGHGHRCVTVGPPPSVRHAVAVPRAVERGLCDESQAQLTCCWTRKWLASQAFSLSESEPLASSMANDAMMACHSAGAGRARRVTACRGDFSERERIAGTVRWPALSEFRAPCR
jgi:hypothetical protein